ncbi:MAG TPA: hypothetical protein VNN55_01210 [bacterium]|nr:hypothetical protein [bacterium]
MKGRFDWKAAYFHLVSLVAVIFFLFAAVSGGHGLLRMLFPALSMQSYEWESVESFTAFKRQYGDGVLNLARPGPERPNSATSAPVTDEELRQAWEEHKRLAVEGQKRQGLWNLLESLATLAVAVPVLLFHRRQAKKLRPEPEPVENTGG